MTESELYQRKIKKWLEQQGTFFFRIEHMRLPDIYTCKNNIVIWYELKTINDLPKSGIIKPDWRPGQLAWIKEHQSKGNDNVSLILWLVDDWYVLKPKEHYTNMEDLNEHRRKPV